jgi:hypothetical protein
MKPKQQDLSPRRIYWSVVTMFSLAGLLVLSIIGGAIWGLVKAVQQLPWIG